MDRHRGLEMLDHRGLYQTMVEQIRRDAPSPSSLFTSLCAADPILELGPLLDNCE